MIFRMIKQHPLYKVQLFHRTKLLNTCVETQKQISKYLRPIKNINGIELIIIEDKIYAFLDGLFEKLRKQISEHVYEYIDLTIELYSGIHVAKTNSELNEEELKGFEQELKKDFVIESYHNSFFDSRITAIRNRIFNMLKDDFLALLGQEINGLALAAKINERIQSSLPVRGGTIYGGMETLLLSEEIRMYHKAALEFFKLNGLRYARFCLTPQHRREDICDKLAAYTDLNIARQCKKIKLNPEGIYPLEEFPDPPHPRAFYYIQPIYELGFFLEKDDHRINI